MRQQAINRALADCQSRLLAQRSSHGVSVQFLVALDAQGSHCRTFARIDETELDTGLIRVPRHLPAHRINFFDQMPLRYASDRRITGHLCNPVAIHREQQGARTHARRGQGGLTACMTSAHYDDINDVSHVHLFLLTDTEF